MNIEFFIACTLLGLEYIHQEQILHRDIKPENLVLDQKGYIHITDFGIAKKYQPNNAKDTNSNNVLKFGKQLDDITLTLVLINNKLLINS